MIISLIGEIAEGIDRLIDQGALNEKKQVNLYGLDRYSFAMRTILAHRGIEVHAFVSDDRALVLKTKREIQDFACRYFKSERDAIQVLTIEEMHDSSMDNPVILVASAGYDEIAQHLYNYGIEGAEVFKVYDFYNKDIDGAVIGKRQLSLDEIKSVEKDMLDIVDKYCLDNNIRYWVSGGTMLGTVRHKGFIPWDDDVDIFLPLNDYFRFLKSFPCDERYEFYGFGPWGSGDFLWDFAKMIDRTTLLDHDIKVVRNLTGIWVDIIPIVGVPEDEYERKLFFRGYQETVKSILQEFYKKDGDIRVFRQRFHEQRDFITRYDFDDSEYVGVLGTWYGENDYCRKTVYDHTLRMKFEDIEVNVPTGYEEYLSALYGEDWMIPPRKSQRGSQHKIRAYRA